MKTGQREVTVRYLESYRRQWRCTPLDRPSPGSGTDHGLSQAAGLSVSGRFHIAFDDLEDQATISCLSLPPTSMNSAPPSIVTLRFDLHREFLLVRRLSNQMCDVFLVLHVLDLLGVGDELGSGGRSDPRKASRSPPATDESISSVFRSTVTLLV